MYDENQYSEIIKLKNQIQEAAFKKQTIPYKDKGKEKEFSFYGKIRIFREGQNIPPVPFNEDLKDVDDLSIVVELSHKVDSFILNVAELIWCHKQTLKPENSKVMLAEMKAGQLNMVRRNLQDLGFGKTAISEALKPLRKDLDVRLRKFKRTRDYKYFHQTRLMGHDRQERENDVISKIRLLYKKHSTLNGTQIRSNMAIIFKATEIWNDADLKEYIDRLKKRFQKIDKTAYRDLSMLDDLPPSFPTSKEKTLKVSPQPDPYK